jgi:2,4-dienoyl-CoA reductase-like NADH-dependent reductase (Old Yellow Enzyme family)
VGIDESYPIVADSYLESLPERYAKSARLAEECGFDGVDIKLCHRYLLNELLACRTRPGKYGGSFENRTRLPREVAAAVKSATSHDFILAFRFNVYDAHPYPYGFGAKPEEGGMEYDPEEPMRLGRMLVKCGARLLSNSAGNPYYIYPQVTRPFDTSSSGIPIPDEHPLESTARLFGFTRSIQAAAGDIPVVGNGYSWMRQFLPYAGAANLAEGSCRFVGLGRSSFAYPNAPLDILRGNGMDPRKVCIACSKCTQIMRDHGRTGCVVRDAAIYAPIYREARDETLQRENASR